MAAIRESHGGEAAASSISDDLEPLAGIGQHAAASLDVSRTLQRALSRIVGRPCAEAAHFPAQALLVGIAPKPMGASGLRVTELPLDGGYLAVLSDGVTEWRGASGAMPGAGGLKTRQRELVDLAPVARLAAPIERSEPGDGVLHHALTMLLVEYRECRA